MADWNVWVHGINSQSEMSIAGMPVHPVAWDTIVSRPAKRWLASVIISPGPSRRITKIDIRCTHGSKKRIALALAQLGYRQPNTSASERFDGTARRMSAH